MLNLNRAIIHSVYKDSCERPVYTLLLRKFVFLMMAKCPSSRDGMAFYVNPCKLFQELDIRSTWYYFLLIFAIIYRESGKLIQKSKGLISFIGNETSALV